MAPRDGLQNIQYNILASAESGLPLSKVPLSLLQPPGVVPPKRSPRRLTSNSVRLCWGMVSLLVLSIILLGKGFGYALNPKEQKAILAAIELSPADKNVEGKKRLSDLEEKNSITTASGPANPPEVKVAKKNERITLGQPQVSENNEDKLLKDAIEALVKHPWPKMVPPIEVLSKGSDSCAEATQTNKIALLFLTRGNLYHEPIWKEWFRSAAGKLPIESTLDTQNLCTKINDSSSIKDTDIIASQHLFNVYIHAPPTFNDSKFTPLWQNHLIQNRLNPTWGSADLVQATRFLLWEAFRDPSNQRFILLSESDIPLFNPLVFYRQLMGEDRSRVNAWERPAWQVDAWRWTWRMAMAPHKIRQSMWRKSSQWFSLIRSHVELILNDNDVFRGFENYCKSGWDADYNKWRDCYTDEHYIPTLLAMNHLENETFQEVGSGTYADWSRGGAHPREFKKEDISVEFFGGKLGIDPACLTPNLNREILSRHVDATFLEIDEMDEMSGDGDGGDLNSSIENKEMKIKCEDDSGCISEKKHDGEGQRRDFLQRRHDQSRLLAAMAPPLKPTCYVSTRKFGPDTVDILLDEIYLRCYSGLALLDKDVCERARAKRIQLKRRRAVDAEERK